MGEIEDKVHLSPAKAEIGAELGNLNNLFNERAAQLKKSYYQNVVEDLKESNISMPGIRLDFRALSTECL